MSKAPTLTNVDLNLLHFLDVLLKERNVTRAADRLNLSQPAVSSALKRLRRHFNDDLLVRVGNQFQLTSLAVELSERAGVALTALDSVFSISSDFDPATSDREFIIMVSDYALAVLDHAISMALAEQAPRVRLRLQNASTATVEHSAEILRTAHGTIVPHHCLTSELPHVNLYTDTWRCMVAEDNRTIGAMVTLADLGQLPRVSCRSLMGSMIDMHLATHGIAVRAQVLVDCFTSMPCFVAGTERIALLPTRLADKIAPTAGVRFLPCPFEFSPLMEALWWHPMYEHDPAHQWLRGLVHKAANTLC